jgi:UDP-N-acetylglucosamine 2-epimerase (non-hydrolysing)
VANTICFVVGARPNFMKAAPVFSALRERGLEPILIHTGQHYDPEMSEVFLRELSLPKPDVVLGVGSGTHAEQTSRALIGIERALVERRPQLVVVSGDVNSTLAGALAAVKLGIPVVHVEAGLRSFDPTMPEEHNRRVTDHLSSLLLVHSRSAVDNLATEGIGGDGVQLVGNTMIDSLLVHLDRARELEPWRGYGLDEHGYALVTLHRPALVDDTALLAETVTRLGELGATIPVLFPAHPRTAARLAGDTVANVTIVKPLGYLEFLGLESAARLVLTDSGGVQEETSALRVPCFTLRETTERPVTIELGTNTLLGLDPARIADIPELLGHSREPGAIPLWDGHAGERAADAIVRFVAAASTPALLR